MDSNGDALSCCSKCVSKCRQRRFTSLLLYSLWNKKAELGDVGSTRMERCRVTGVSWQAKRSLFGRGPINPAQDLLFVGLRKF